MKKLDLFNKNIIVFGLGVTGKSSIKALSNMKANVFIYDDRKYEDYKTELEDLADFNFEIIDNYSDLDWEVFDYLLKSPGIKNTNKFLMSARENNLEIVSDIELAYRIWGGANFIAITGTNGKTTTTSLVAHILNYSDIEARVVGNIGVSILWDMINHPEAIFVIEMSSFQLDASESFKPKIALITNITEDHIDWHGNFEAYKKAKFNIFKNQDENDLLILNQDDQILSDVQSKSKIEKFSLLAKSDAYLKADEIIYHDKDNYFSFNKNIIKLVGNHNIANILAAILIVKEFDIDKNSIVNAIGQFSPIEHRIEFVEEINGVKYYNDSKGTNIDSTKVALSGFDKNVLLIAGGYDKGSDFRELFHGNKNINKLITFGATREKLANAARENNIDTSIVDDLEEAVKLAKETEGIDTVLFSPACASWGMYKNYEVRGKHFKKLVRD